MTHSIDFKELNARELFDGIRARIAHSDNMTVMYVELDENAILPQHHHPQEQWTNVIEGKLEMTIDGITSVFEAGMVARLLPNVPHSAKALTKCFAIDVFSPARTDLKEI